MIREDQSKSMVEARDNHKPLAIFCHPKYIVPVPKALSTGLRVRKGDRKLQTIIRSRGNLTSAYHLKKGLEESSSLE